MLYNKIDILLFAEWSDFMLLEFRASNYKSFKDELIFSLMPASNQKEMDYSILKEVSGEKVYEGLCSSVIYGPNASGKTNIIGAMDTFKEIVLRGHLRNYKENKNISNFASNALELIPNSSLKKSLPVSFAIKFISEKMLVEYSFMADLGTFLEREYSRKVIKEELKINEMQIFYREKKLEIKYSNLTKGVLSNEFLDSKNIDVAMLLAENNLHDDELFLMNGFKNIISSTLVAIISEWLENKFVVIYRADSVYVTGKIHNPKERSVYVGKTINKVAKYFGINSNALGYVVQGENNEAKLCSVFEKKAIPAEIFESYGTIRFINIFPLIIKTVLEGGTLIVDEFDASIHPMALMNIVNIFHNNDINVFNAQLIFNTHNPIFLNSNLCRRDEIKFVERDEDTHYSCLYSLSDFKTVRSNDDYMKNYFIDRYGAIKDVDFSPIFKELIDNTHRKEENI